MSFRYSLLVFLCVPVSVFAASVDWVIVFDSTKTLFEVQEDALAQEIPAFTSGVKYALWNMNFNPRKQIEQEFRRILFSCGKQAGGPEELVRGQDEKPLAGILVRWLGGSITPQSFTAQVALHADYDIFTTIAEYIVKPEMIAKHTKLIPGALRLVSQCVQLVGKEKLFVAGNWDQFSYSLLRNQGATRALFEYIPMQRHLISGNTHQLFPRDARSIFDRIARQAGVCLEHIIFISGMKYHVKAAQQAGVHAFLISPQQRGSVYEWVQRLIAG